MIQIDWNGAAGSTEADDIDHLLNVMIVLSSFVYSIVLVMLGYSIWRYRAKPGDESDGEPIHGNTRLEIAWTLIPTVIVLFGAAYSWVILDRIEAREPDRLQVDVTAQQFAWKFEYPEQKVTSTELHVPVDRQIEFSMKAIDVIHSFWVPEWRMKKDLVPGQTTHVLVDPGPRGQLRADLHRAVRDRPLDDARARSSSSRRRTSTSGSQDQGGKPRGRAAGGRRRRRRGARSAGAAGRAAIHRAGLRRLPHAGRRGLDRPTVGPNLDEVLPPGRPARSSSRSSTPAPRSCRRASATGSCPTTSADTLKPQAARHARLSYQGGSGSSQ